MVLPFFGNKLTATTHFPARLATIKVPENAQYLSPETMTMRMLPCDVFGMVIPTACATRDALTRAPRFALTVLITTAGSVVTVLDVGVAALLSTDGGVLSTASAGAVEVVVVG